MYSRVTTTADCVLLLERSKGVDLQSLIMCREVTNVGCSEVVLDSAEQGLGIAD